MGGGSGVAAGAAAAELAALNLSGGDEAAMKAIEQRISAGREEWKLWMCLPVLAPCLLPTACRCKGWVAWAELQLGLSIPAAPGASSLLQVLAEKAAMEQKLARMEANYKAEIEALKAVRQALQGLG